VRRSLAIVSLTFAWLCANSAIWDAAQLVAWAKMFAGYAQTLSVSAALEETFDASKPCDLCRNVAKAKETEQKQAPQTIEQAVAGKLLLACETPARVVIEVPFADWPDAPSRTAPTRTERVPVPPPRA
jgi:hypothetical protein